MAEFGFSATSIKEIAQRACNSRKEKYTKLKETEYLKLKNTSEEIILKVFEIFQISSNDDDVFNWVWRVKLIMSSKNIECRVAFSPDEQAEFYPDLDEIIVDPEAKKVYSGKMQKFNPIIKQLNMIKNFKGLFDKICNDFKEINLDGIYEFHHTNNSIIITMNDFLDKIESEIKNEIENEDTE